MVALMQAAWPYASVLVAGFGAATLLPLPSEVVLAAQIKASDSSILGLVAAATAGNVGGSVCNWWLGRFLHRFKHRKWFPFAPRAVDKAAATYRRWGLWTLLLAWLPVIGDPLTLVAGLLRVPLMAFIPLVTIGKAGRYLALAYGIDLI
jgi:membrane protein YqaA with SNARE-associated domain